MGTWQSAFLVLALVAALFGFTGPTAASAIGVVAKALFCIFMMLYLVEAFDFRGSKGHLR